MLSIITVVFNDLEGLKQTYNSVMNQKKYFSNFEYIIIDGNSEDGTKEFIQNNSINIDYFVSEPDKGIYDAMNKGIKAAKGDSLLFLNAGDYFVDNVLGNYTKSPVFIKVKYSNIFRKYKEIKIKKFYYSIPNCHQGIIFENKSILYDTRYSICSDYKYFLDHYKNQKISILDSEGFIHFDSKGLSSTKIVKRDNEMFYIRKQYFGIVTAYCFAFFSLVKQFIRVILRKI